MPCCSAYGCSNKSDKKVKSVTYHKFPKNDEIKEKWIRALRRQNFTPSKHSVVCSAHFPEESIDRTSLSCVRLRHGAIPSIFPSFPAYLQENSTLRKPRTLRSSYLEPLNDESNVLEDTKPFESSPKAESKTLSSPGKTSLKRKLHRTQGKLHSSRKKIKTLLQSRRRLMKKNAELKNIISNLRKNEQLIKPP